MVITNVDIDPQVKKNRNNDGEPSEASRLRAKVNGRSRCAFVVVASHATTTSDGLLRCICIAVPYTIGCSDTNERRYGVTVGVSVEVHVTAEHVLSLNIDSEDTSAMIGTKENM